MYVQTCAGGLAQPQQESYPQQESGCDSSEGITERDTPVGMYHVCWNISWRHCMVFI